MNQETKARAKALVAKMTPAQKVALMTGSSNLDALREGWRRTGSFSVYPYTAGGCDEYDIPPLRFSDGPKGAVCGVEQSTCFPSSVLRGAAFDTQLEQEIGAAIGRELRAYGVNLFGGVCVNLPYHPGWGRSQDVYGEESFALGQLGAALVRGVQGEGVMACVKHFAFNSIENSRFTCDKRTEQEVFLPHFKDCIDAGAACVMGAYNRFRGTPCCENEYLLTTVLRESWGFDGFVISEWFDAVGDTARAVRAGLDVEMPTPKHYGAALLEAVRKKQVPESAVDEAAERIVATILAFADAPGGDRQYSRDVIGCKAHADLALRAAREGVTLLKNAGGVLPFSPAATRRVAVLGPLAIQGNLGDHSSSQVFPSHVVTLLDGVSQLLPRAEIVYYGCENLFHARRVAAEADAVILVAGYTYRDEGEYMTQATSPEYRTCIGGDRQNLRLRPEEVRLIEEVAPLNPRTAVVLIGGGAIVPTPWIDRVPAVLLGYYPGQEGGTALSEILFGKVNPSGRLPFVIPRREEDLPEVDWNAEQHHYEYYHGYAKLEKEGRAPLFPYGFGLSYTTFAVSDAEFSRDETRLYAACRVRNTGGMAGETVIQLYVGFDRSRLDRPHKLLRGFARVALRPGECKAVRIACPLDKLRYYDEESGAFRLEHMPHEVYIGTSCDEKDLLKGSIEL